jgi:hypothetical protein
MCAAAAEITRQRFSDLAVRRFGIFIQQGFARHDHAVDAVAALGRLFIDEGLLNLVHFLGRAQASRVVTDLFCTALIGVTQERMALPSMMTVQAPH